MPLLCVVASLYTETLVDLGPSIVPDVDSADDDALAYEDSEVDKDDCGDGAIYVGVVVMPDQQRESERERERDKLER